MRRRIFLKKNATAILTAIYNVTSTTSSTQIGNQYSQQSNFSSIEIDGVVQPSVVSEYTFSTTGEHTVKYDLINPELLGDGAFSNCENLISLNSNVNGECNIPNGIIDTSGGTFTECRGLTSINLPNSLQVIGDTAFQGCENIRRVNSNIDGECIIPNNVLTIYSFAFLRCLGIEKVFIPSNTSIIGVGTFEGCLNIINIMVSSENNFYDSRNNCNAIIETSTNILIQGCKNTVIPNTVTSIGYGAFSNCHGLTSIDIPSSVTSIGSYAFTNCHGLTSINIPSSVTSIGYGAFSDCISLTSIDIPSSVTSIDSYAFSGCISLSSVTVRATTPPTLGSNAFFSNASNRKIYVPSASVNTYKAASGWSTYASYIEAIP